MKKMRDHLSNIDSQKREPEAIFRLFCVMGYPQTLVEVFNIDSRFCIIGVNIPFHYITGEKKKSGDIDLCIIPIKTQVPNEQEVLVEPDFRNILAAEIKVMVFKIDDSIKSSKVRFDIVNLKEDNKQEGTRKQVKKLLDKGFNKTYLLYIIATEPSKSEYGDFTDIFVATDRVNVAFNKIDQRIYVDDQDEYSTLGLYVGALDHKLEQYSGVETLTKFHENRNIRKTSDNEFRGLFESAIRTLFPFRVPKLRFPLLIRACSDNDCKNIYLSYQGEQMKCPKCNSLPY